MTDLKRALEYAAMKADQRDYNDRRSDDANLKASFLKLVGDLEEETRRGDEARAVLRKHIADMEREGETEAATGTGEFADCAPCECAGCTTYRLALGCVKEIP